MDFIIGLLRNFRQHNTIMVLVNKLSKSTDFIPIKSTYKAVNIEKYFYEINFQDTWPTKGNNLR